MRNGGNGNQSSQTLGSDSNPPGPFSLRWVDPGHETPCSYGITYSSQWSDTAIGILDPPFDLSLTTSLPQDSAIGAQSLGQPQIQCHSSQQDLDNTSNEPFCPSSKQVIQGALSSGAVRSDTGVDFPLKQIGERILGQSTNEVAVRDILDDMPPRMPQQISNKPPNREGFSSSSPPSSLEKAMMRSPYTRGYETPFDGNREVSHHCCGNRSWYIQDKEESFTDSELGRQVNGPKAIQSYLDGSGTGANISGHQNQGRHRSWLAAQKQAVKLARMPCVQYKCNPSELFSSVRERLQVFRAARQISSIAHQAPAASFGDASRSDRYKASKPVTGAGCNPKITNFGFAQSHITNEIDTGW
jgi:hypothetical protein